MVKHALTKFQDRAIKEMLKYDNKKYYLLYYPNSISCCTYSFGFLLKNRRSGEIDSELWIVYNVKADFKCHNLSCEWKNKDLATQQMQEIPALIKSIQVYLRSLH